jgi:tRNA(fMet)-specific endonuclease VapC
MWLLDTNAWIAYLQRNPNAVKNKIASVPESSILLCDVVKAELIYGAYKSARVDDNLGKLDILFSLVNSLPFDGNAAREFGEIRAYLARQGTPIGPYDLQIAAIAKAHDLTLVTHNTREFSRVIGLRLEDWESIA